MDDDYEFAEGLTFWPHDNKKYFKYILHFARIYVKFDKDINLYRVTARYVRLIYGKDKMWTYDGFKFKTCEFKPVETRDKVWRSISKSWKNTNEEQK